MRIRIPPFSLFTGTANPDLAAAIARALDHPLSHPALGEICVTDTVPPHHKDWPQLKVVSIAPSLAAAIQRLAARESIGDLFQ